MISKITTILVLTKVSLISVLYVYTLPVLNISLVLS